MVADDFVVGVLALLDYRVSPAPSVAAQPLVELHAWRVLEDANSALHLYGQIDGSQKQRMTTAIRQIDWVQRRWVTSSGRVYLTHSAPGNEIEADVLNFLACHHRMSPPLTDLTSSVWNVMKEVLQ